MSALLINWSIVFLTVFVLLVGVLFAAAPGFVRINKGESNESVSVSRVVLWSLLFTVVITGGAILTLYLTGKGGKTLGFGCGCGGGKKWGLARGSSRVQLPELDMWSQSG